MNTSKLKTKYNSATLAECFALMQEAEADYREHRYRRLTVPYSQPSSTFAVHSSMFLLSSVQRSRLLFYEFIDVVYSDNINLAYFAVRGHHETTASVAYFLFKLRKYYNKELTAADIEDIAFKLSLGARKHPPKAEYPERPDVPSILTQIETADKLLSAMSGSKDTQFMEEYEYLSEFCHPNFFGLTLGTTIPRENEMLFHHKPKISVKRFSSLSHSILLSCTYFFFVFKEALAYLKSNESMPIFSKH